MHDSHHGICVRVAYVGLQATEIGPVVKASKANIMHKFVNILNTNPKSKSSTPNFEYSISTRR